MIDPNLPPNVYRLAQNEFDSIPSSPWVYRISDSLRTLFKKLPLLGSIAQPKQGFASADNFRFIRFWWEVGHSRIGFNFRDRHQAYKSKFKWFPCMKSGGRLWYTSQIEVVNWEKEAKEMRAFDKAYIRNPDYHFREGAAYSSVSSSGLSFRWMPSGFICEHATNAIYSESRSWSHLALVGLFNSTLANYIVGLNETININIEDLLRMPICQEKNLEALVKLVEDNLRIRLFEDIHTELYLGFSYPMWWKLFDIKLDEVINNISTVEIQIDNEVFHLYQISPEDRNAIEVELASGPLLIGDTEQSEKNSEENESEEPSYAMTPQELAVRWISYAVGIVLGRFQPGESGTLGSTIYRRSDFAIGSLPAPNESEFDELVGPPERFAYIDTQGGRHVFSAEVEERLRALADTDGIMVLDEGHPDDLPAKVERALELMLGETGAAEVIQATTGETYDLPQALRRFLERDFFTKWHVKWYRKRPIYWLLQSPRKLYGVYIFHERLTKDTLFMVQRNYVDHKLALTGQLLNEKRTAAEKAGSARERRDLNKEAEDLEKLLLDLEEFSLRLKAITDRGYDPDIDDGVILNMAPLWEVIPSWSKEPQKYWNGLERGDYDWAHIAMYFWPERVKEKCKRDKSLAIAHGHEEMN